MSRPRRAVLPALALAALLLHGGATHAADDPVGSWPLRPEPTVVTRFDPPTNPYGAGHRGVDLLGRPGQTVHAALPGTVAFAGRIAGRGVVVVGHGATRTTYEPVAASVSIGDAVVGGAPIGTVEPTGSHCAPRTCLHWGWREGEDYLDPLRLVGDGPVRLVPLDGLGGSATVLPRAARSAAAASPSTAGVVEPSARSGRAGSGRAGSGHAGSGHAGSGHAGLRAI
ncbi:murein DD-endopeptidase MepM/ murein hydrolase activator NlpD [Nocardioides zeae]|uniref:Murein DD-endopeptidase MepM/ murein hydrolase activator NlpD n=1 Tax=Nocardioides zeae TaxID=1457234 RepID=A0ACC6IHK1_9ACTN|nr:M23 family metallopeptidase [Nocardioides zeae]MDR6173150.1 murein DD-endopeptidase MepM/ murein hydrolase activator NlpD [Nocardioides zeae]MDR6210143.1 murein DD-endopeptidase MepM/ murein hydrolase activator NlpD [Nocardioides zeae]